MLLPNDRTGPAGVGPAPDTLAVGASGVALSLEQPTDTAPVAALDLGGEVTE
jgi:hypothetical protein